MKTYTADEVSEILGDAGREKANAWLARGDGIAVYRNEDLGSGDVGSIKFMSFGSAEAQFVVPPEQLPDFPSEINWRFRLHGVYRSTTLLTAPAVHDWVSLGTILDMFVRNFTIDSLPERKKWPEGRITEVGLTLYAISFMHVNAKVLTWDQRSVNVTLTALAPDRVVDRLGEFMWSVTVPGVFGVRAAETTNGTEANLGSAFVKLYNVSLDKED